MTRAEYPLSERRRYLEADAPSTTKPNVTVNAAFLQEIKEDDRQLKELLEQLSNLLDSSNRTRDWGIHFGGLLGKLRDQLACHFRLEEAFGYFDDPVTVAPQFACRAAGLRAQHGSLLRDICALADAAQRSTPPPVVEGGAAALIEQVRTFCAKLAQHEQDENELIQRAYTDDLGVGD